MKVVRGPMLERVYNELGYKKWRAFLDAFAFVVIILLLLWSLT